MNCEDCREVLIDFAHEELPAPERAHTARHLAECEKCALEFCRLRADLEGIVHAGVAAPGPAVQQALRARVAAEFSSADPERAPWWRRAGRFASRPVPVYGVALAAAVPLALWLGTSRASISEHASVPMQTVSATLDRPATLTDYDASTTPRPGADLW